MAAIRRALISVYDKSGVRELAEALSARDVEILSTGGTARLLEEIGVRVTSVSDYTGQEEILGGRVKTLHPRIFGGSPWRPCRCIRSWPHCSSPRRSR